MKKYAFYLLWLFVFTIPFENIYYIPGIGTISRLAGILACIIGIFASFFNERLRAFGSFQICFGLFIYLSTMSFFWSYDQEISRKQIFTFVQLFIFVWLLWEYARTEEEQESLMFAYVLGAYVSIFNIIKMYFYGIKFGYFRYSAQGFDPNEVALIIAMGVPIAWKLSLNRGRKSVATLCKLFVPLSCIAVVLTASRASFIALIIAIMFILLSFNELKSLQKVFYSSGIIIFAFILYEVLPNYLWARLGSIHGEVFAGTLNSRTIIWREAFALFTEHPLFGVGIGGFGSSIEPLLGFQASSHNLFLSILVELGLAGFSIFFIMIIISIKSIFNLSSLNIKMWSILLLTLGIGGMALNYSYNKPTWFLLGLLACQGALEIKRHKIGL